MSAQHERNAGVYFIEAVGTRRVKIGMAVDIGKRLSQLQVGSPAKLELLGFLRTDDALRLERSLHDKFEHLWVRGEWFRLTKHLRSVIADLTLDGRGSPFQISYNRSEPAPVVIGWMPTDTVKTFSERVWRVAHALEPDVFVEEQAA